MKAELEDGRTLTALEIQSEYLEACERALQKGVLPGWAGEAVAHWRETLGDLERDPRRLADRLDPYCKLVIFEHELRRTGCDWADLRRALATLSELHLSSPQRSCRRSRRATPASTTPRTWSFPRPATRRATWGCCTSRLDSRRWS